MLQPPPPTIKCYNMGHDVHGLNLYECVMIIKGDLHPGGHYDRLILSHSTPETGLSI